MPPLMKNCPPASLNQGLRSQHLALLALLLQGRSEMGGTPTVHGHLSPGLFQGVGPLIIKVTVL